MSFFIKRHLKIERTILVTFIIIFMTAFFPQIVYASSTTINEGEILTYDISNQYTNYSNGQFNNTYYSLIGFTGPSYAVSTTEGIHIRWDTTYQDAGVYILKYNSNFHQRYITGQQWVIDGYNWITTGPFGQGYYEPYGHYEDVYTETSGTIGNYSVIFTVNDVNQPPVIALIGNRTISEGEFIEIQINSYDPDGDDLTHSVTGLPEGATFDKDSSIFRWTPTYLQEGIYPNICFSVTDGVLAASTSITITVNNTNILPPIANAGGPYSGKEGSPITFDGSGSGSICGTPVLRWDFSDGGTEYGIFPSHTFAGPGNYSGQLTVTDYTGQSSKTTLSIDVENEKPVVNPGPDMFTKWGVPVTLNGSALNPGTAQQPYLTYRWDFGDGAASASGGVSATHVYTLPGTYIATFTATDPLGASSSGTTQISVVKRDVILVYSGLLKSKTSQSVMLSAVMTDEMGNPLAGRTVSFNLGAQGTFNVMTDSKGVAVYNLKLKQKNGGYPLTVQFIRSVADEKLYNSASTSVIFTISK